MKNVAILVGKVISTPRFSHKVNEEEFYVFNLSVKRTSGIKDVIPIIIPVEKCSTWNILTNLTIKVIGEIRSFYSKNSFPKLKILFFAKDIILNENEDPSSNNCVLIEGIIGEQPNFKITASNRQITNLLIASDRNYKRSDYIPCIAWGRNASYALTIPVGTKIEITGRIQSRKYIKIHNNINTEINICEVSVKEIHIVND